MISESVFLFRVDPKGQTTCLRRRVPEGWPPRHDEEGNDGYEKIAHHLCMFMLKLSKATKCLAIGPYSSRTRAAPA